MPMRNDSENTFNIIMKVVLTLGPLKVSGDPPSFPVPYFENRRVPVSRHGLCDPYEA